MKFIWCNLKNKNKKFLSVSGLTKHVFVTEQDFIGPFRTDPASILSALAPLWSTQITVSEAHFLSCFTDAKTPTKWKKLTTWWPWACSPQTYWHLRIDTANPCDTTLLTHHQPIRIVHKLTTYPGMHPTPKTLPLQILCWNPSCLAPFNKHCTFLHHNPVSVDWLYCAWANEHNFGSVTFISCSFKAFYMPAPSKCSCSPSQAFRLLGANVPPPQTRPRGHLSKRRELVSCCPCSSVHW